MRHSLQVLFPRPLDPDDLFHFSAADFIRGRVRAPAASWAWLLPVYYQPYADRITQILKADGQNVTLTVVGQPPHFEFGPSGAASPYGIVLPEPVPMTLERLVRLMDAQNSEGRSDAFFRFLDLAGEDINKKRLRAAIAGTSLAQLAS